MAQHDPSNLSTGGRNPWPHRLALLTSAATVILILAGGLVTSTSSGLAVPDWPTTFGYNMFLYPWTKMVGGIFIEHSHRLLGSLVGLLTILTAAAIWLTDERRWLRRLAAVSLGLVILQGVFGGMRVLLLKLNLAILHACTAQLFFGLMVSISLFTSRGWALREPASGPPDAKLHRLSLTTCVLIYLQTILGAFLRHTGTHFYAHALFAVVVAAHVLWLSTRILKSEHPPGNITAHANALWVLLIAQVALGVASLLTKYTFVGDAVTPGVIVLFTSAHVLVGALLFAEALVVALLLRRAGTGEALSSQASVLAGGASA